MKRFQIVFLSIVMVFMSVSCNKQAPKPGFSSGDTSSNVTSSTETDPNSEVFETSDTRYTQDSEPYYNNEVTEPVQKTSWSTDTKSTGSSDEVGVPAGPGRTITIDTNQIINNDFTGLGGNCLPMGFMPNNLEKGYNEAYWKLDERRIQLIEPKVMRIWFQIDWFEEEPGVYNWNSSKMQSFYKYMDLFKELGTEVELNYSWKNGEAIQDWFSIPGVPGAISAPRDLQQYARDLSNCLDYLINVKGYNNIKYLSYYNEPNGYTDFYCAGDPYYYYAKMAKTVHEQLVKDGRRNLVKIWGSEDSGNIKWFEYLKQNADKYFDAYAYHSYNYDYATLINQYQNRLKTVAPKKTYVTEFGYNTRTLSHWDTTYTSYVIAGANNGISGLCAWQFNGIWLEDPYYDKGLAGGNFPLLPAPEYDINVSQSFYEYGLLMRYLPAHAQVLSTKTNSQDVRAAAFTFGSNDYTIMVQCNKSVAKDLTLNFSENIGKKFNKYIYKPDVLQEPNAILPSKSGEFSAENSFKDSLDSDYCVIVYSTLPPQTQVVMSNVTAKVKAGGQIKLSTSVIDNSEGVLWSVSYGSGTVSNDGLYTAPKDIVSGKMIAVKATSVKDSCAYGITLITIQ